MSSRIPVHFVVGSWLYFDVIQPLWGEGYNRLGGWEVDGSSFDIHPPPGGRAHMRIHADGAVRCFGHIPKDGDEDDALYGLGPQDRVLWLEDPDVWEQMADWWQEVFGERINLEDHPATATAKED